MFDSREAIAVYRGWAALEERLPAEGRTDVIDFDLVPEIDDTEHFDTREQVLARILELRDAVRPVDETTEFIRAKLSASAHYLRALQGEQTEFYSHVRNILGITPELISEDVISEQRTKVLSLLASFGVHFEGEKPVPDGFQAFDDQIRIDKAQGEAQTRDAAAKFLPTVLSLLGLDGLQIPYRTEFVAEDAYWRGWTSGKKGDFLLRYNFHPMHRWRQGDMELLTLHEVCGHFVHAASMARRIEAGQLDPFIGITTVHDPHAFMGEGIADALTYFFPHEIQLSPDAILAMEQYKWRDYLNNNAHILINMGWPEKRLLDYLLDNPFTPEAPARRNLDKWRTNPLWRAYQYSYGISMKYHEDFAARMNRERRITYLRYAFARYVTPRRLIEYVEQL